MMSTWDFLQKTCDPAVVPVPWWGSLQFPVLVFSKAIQLSISWLLFLLNIPCSSNLFLWCLSLRHLDNWHIFHLLKTAQAAVLLKDCSIKEGRQPTRAKLMTSVEFFRFTQTHCWAEFSLYLTKLLPILGVNSWVFVPEDRHKVFSKAALARVAFLSLHVPTVPFSKSTSIPKPAGKLQGKFLYGSHPIAFPYPPHSFCSVMTSYCSLHNCLRLPTSP